MKAFLIIFALLSIIGFVQLILAYRADKRTSILYKTEDTVYARSFEDKLRGYSVGEKMVDLSYSIKRHLFGVKGDKIFKHLVILVLAMLGAWYVNDNYLKVNHLFIFIGVSIIVPYVLYLNSRNKNRIDFEKQFALALNIISSSVSTGNSILQSIDECGNTIEGFVGDEFRLVSQRLEIGEDAEVVFEESYSRMKYREYYFFIVAVMINLKGGGQLKEVITRLAKLISDSRIMERKKSAKIAEAKMSATVLFFLPIVFMVLLKFISPDNLDFLLNDPTGRNILYYAIASDLLGVLIIISMIKKRV